MPTRSDDRLLARSRTMDVEEAINSRHSVRAFLDTPVSMETVKRILATAARAPSGTNMQPWNAWVVAGAGRDRLVRAVLARADAGEKGTHASRHRYYPADMPEPYRARRRSMGWALYGLLGIEKGDRERSWRQSERNYDFFGAPVGIIFTIDQRLEIGSWLDYGLLIQNVCLLARKEGLHTCIQAAWSRVDAVVRETLAIPVDHTVVCGIALGFEDVSAPENALRSSRADLHEWVRFQCE